MKKALPIIAAHLATAVITLLAVRYYTFHFVLIAARQSAFIDRVKSEKELVDFLDTRYVRCDTQHTIEEVK